MRNGLFSVSLQDNGTALLENPMNSHSWSALLAILLLAGGLLVCGQTTQRSNFAAPPMRECKATPATDLGVWDDAFACNEEEIIVLRRDDELFALSTTDSVEPRKLIAAPALSNSTIVAAAGKDDRLWLLIESSQGHPFAINVPSGRLTEFAIPGLKVPGSQTPRIQSHIVVRHSDAALLMIAGGDRATWPRDGNRPVYFWLSLESGEVVQFPVGWDLNYLSADQRVAVFAKPSQKQFEPRQLQAVTLKTGELLAAAPDLSAAAGIPFVWYSHSPIKAFFTLREGTPILGRFAGLSVEGTSVPLDVGMNAARDGSSLDCTAKAHDGFAAFSLKRLGDYVGFPSPFWLADLTQSNKPHLVAKNVTDFALLDDGNCVFVTSGRNRESFEGSVFQVVKQSSWNLLDAVEQPPELSKDLADDQFIEDKLSIRLIEPFGHSHPHALCLFWRYRRDMVGGALVPPTEARVMALSWRRAILVTASGNRYMTHLFREDHWPDQIWLHASGKLIFGDYLWETSSSGRRRKIHLLCSFLQPQDKAE
jgi:hypothetical protein